MVTSKYNSPMGEYGNEYDSNGTILPEFAKLRQANAVAIAEKINSYIDTHFVYDNSGDSIPHKFVIKEDGSVILPWEEGGKGGITYFINDVELDNGMYNTIEEYNAMFKDWTIIPKQDKKKIF